MLNKKIDTLLETLLRHFPAELSEQERTALIRNYSQNSHEFRIWQDQTNTNKFISESCFSLTGYSAHEFLDDNELLEKLIHPNDIALWHQSRQTNKHESIQIRLIKRNGEIAWFEHNCSPLVEEDSELSGHIGNFVDITTAKKAQSTAQKLAIAMEQNNFGVAITDKNGVIEYANPTFIDMQHDTLKVKPGATYAVLDPNNPQSAEIRETVLRGKTWHEDRCIPTNKEPEQWETIKISPIFDEQSLISHYLIVTVDISHHIHNKQHILDQHSKLQELFKQVETSKKEWEQSLDCINDVVILANRSGIIQRINNASKLIFNLDIADAIGRDWRSLLPKELATQTSLPDKGEFYAADLNKWLQYQIFQFPGNTLETDIGQVITLHDATTMWTLNQELSKAYEHQKTTQSQMVHQEKMASIGQLAAGVAHELNNPTGFVTSNLVSLGKYTARLNKHINFLEQAIEQWGNKEFIQSIQQHRKQLKLSVIQEDIEDLIEESLDGAERIKTIVQNLKSFSRIDNSGFTTSNLHECLDAALNIGWNEIKYKATITKDYQPIPDIYCSAQQLNQVFLNLLVNAAQALKDQGKIHIYTATQDPWVIIKISDNGSGIAPEHLSRIFEPFFTTKEVGKGTGLGLSICYDIIQEHHGEITVDSTAEQGTTFTIKLPIIARHEQSTFQSNKASTEDMS